MGTTTALTRSVASRKGWIEEMGVSRGGLRLGMAEQGADDRQ
jgi:hypothetical protein